MDCLETASNASDNQSDCMSSNLSSLSGLTGYEEELYDLKHLIKGRSGSGLSHVVNKSCTNGDSSQYEIFEDRIRKLNTELQNALKMNEQYKNNMYNLERKSELMFHEKLEKLMRHNAQLEAQLVVANERICGFLKKSNESGSKETKNTKVIEFECKITHLEKQNFDTNSKINLLQNEVVHWKNETEANEILNNRLKLELEEMKIDVSTKNYSITGLKNKIVDLHVEMQNLTQNNIKLNNSLLVISNELDSYKKSESWYKEQVKQCRSQKSQAAEEIARLKALLASKEHNLDVQNIVLSKLQNRYEELQLAVHQEKETLLKKIDKLESNASIKSESLHVINTEDHSAMKIYESTIQSLTSELSTIKTAISDQNISFDNLNKQNSQLLARNTILQKTLNEKEICIGNLESEKNDLNAKFEILNERLQQNKKLLMKAVNERSEMEIALNSANREKSEIEEVVNTIRDNFTKFAGKYNKIKEELQGKAQLVFALQNEKLGIKGDLEQLEFCKVKIKEMEESNNKLEMQVENFRNNLESVRRNLEETNKVNEKLKSEVMSHQNSNLNLKEHIESYKQTIIAAKDLEIKQINKKIENERENFKEIKNKLESEVRLLKEAIANLKAEFELFEKNSAVEKEVNIKRIKEKFENEIILCNRTKNNLESEVVSYQKITTNLKKELEVIKQNMATLVNNLQLKDEEIHNLSQNINNLKSDIAIREQRFHVTQEILERCKIESCEIDHLNKVLQNENSDLKNKLAEFVMNNCNGYNRTNIEKQDRLEWWFSSILKEIISSLHDIGACRNLKCNISVFPAKCVAEGCSEEIKKNIFEIEQALVELSSSTSTRIQELQKINLSNEQLKRKFNNVKNRLLQLEDKCKLLEKRNQTDDEALSDLKIAVIENANCKQIQFQKIDQARLNEEKLLEEIKNLKTLRKAKEMENKERQKRYEINNRTLLKKVKEHMRGRNSAEKRCNYLQELYNNLFDELNSYKLQDGSKEGEIQNLRNVCDNYKNISERTKQQLLRSEKELAKVQAKYADYELLKENVTSLEMKLNKYEDEIQSYVNKLKEKEIVFNNLQVKLQKAVLNNASVEKENGSLQKQIEELNEAVSTVKQEILQLEELLERERITVRDLQNDLSNEQKQHSICIVQFENVQQSLQHIQEKYSILSEEVEALESKLIQTNSELTNLHEQKDLLENKWHIKETHMHSFVMNLQSDIEILQNDVSSVKSDKYFLQRLCNDLKIALQTSVNQSKALKKQIQTLSSESKHYTSLPNPATNLPSPSKYDDAYINQLLKQSSNPSKNKPLSDLENCLNSLKKEMICLRKQVTEKTGYPV